MLIWDASTNALVIFKTLLPENLSNNFIDCFIILARGPINILVRHYKLSFFLFICFSFRLSKKEFFIVSMGGDPLSGFPTKPQPLSEHIIVSTFECPWTSCLFLS